MEAYEQFATVYDRLMSSMPYDRWLSFAQFQWEKYGTPQTIADLGCGTGTLSIRLAAAGHDVFAIDLASDMLTVAQAKWDEYRLQHRQSTGDIEWIEQDMCELELPQAVDSVISFCDCINYLTEPENVIATFEAVYAVLRAGGTFLFDVHAPAQLVRYAEEQPYVLNDDDVSYIWTSDYDDERQEIEHHLTIFVQQAADVYRRFEEVHVQRSYAGHFIQQALRDAGFKIVEQYADFLMQPPSSTSERLFFVAQK